MTAYAKACGHIGWCACVKHRNPGDHAVQPLGDQPQDEATISIYRTYRSRSAIRVGAESPLRRLDESSMGIGQGDRVVIHDRYNLGPGTAQGPVTIDNEGIWFVTFDNGREDTFDYRHLERVYEL